MLITMIGWFHFCTIVNPKYKNPKYTGCSQNNMHYLFLKSSPIWQKKCVKIIIHVKIKFRLSISWMFYFFFLQGDIDIHQKRKGILGVRMCSNTIKQDCVTMEFDFFFKRQLKSRFGDGTKKLKVWKKENVCRVTGSWTFVKLGEISFKIYIRRNMWQNFYQVFFLIFISFALEMLSLKYFKAPAIIFIMEALDT